jgi:hypothetical protein
MGLFDVINIMHFPQAINTELSKLVVDFSFFSTFEGSFEFCIANLAVNLFLNLGVFVVSFVEILNKLLVIKTNHI